MKKSKVIIPAMALLLFSTAASVTGTVAWFSSTRVFSMQAAQFGINNVDGNLKATIAARVGTQNVYEGGDTEKPVIGVEAGHVKSGNTITQKNRLFHGSVDSTSEAWIINRDPSADNSDYFQELGTESECYSAEHPNEGDVAHPWIVRETTESTIDYKYYVAFSWNITFEYSLGTAEGNSNIAVFLDLKDSKIELTSNTPIATAETGNAGETIKGFRIGFFSSTADINFKHLVLGANSGEDYGYVAAASKDVTQGSYVHANATYSNGTESNYLCPNTGYTRRAAAGVSSADATAASERLFTLSSGHLTATVTCVAWFEGQDDDNIISGSRMDDVTAKLAFYARPVI